VINIDKYIGKYRVFAPVDLTTGKITSNEFDRYLIGKSKCEISRYKGNADDPDSVLVVYFHSGVNVISKNIIPSLEELGVEMTLLLDLDGECAYTFFEKDIHIAHKILKYQVKGKNVKPSSIRTARRQNKVGGK